VRYLVAPLAQRRDVDADDTEAVVEVLAELAFAHALFEVGVGGRQHPHVHVLRARVAYGQDLALLEKAEELRLHIEGRSPTSSRKSVPPGRADEPRLVVDRAREAAAMPKSCESARSASWSCS
jgi:hypothetical protein